MTRVARLAGFLLLISSFWYGNAKVPCPAPSQGCDCEDATKGYVTCSGMNEMPQNLPSNVTFLDLDSNSIGSMLLVNEMAKLNNLALSQLYLSGNGLEAIENRAFMSQLNIRTLDLSNNNFRSLDGQVFFGLTQLQTLFLTKSSIYELTSVVFTYTPALKFLDLDDNKLTTITTQFSSLSNLQTLLLSSNEFATIGDSSFQSQSDLQRLELFGNKLTTPRKKWFAHLMANNGTLKLSSGGEPENPWTCCGETSAGYKDFVDSLSASLQSLQQYNVLCSSPEKVKGQRINEADLSVCNSTFTTTTALVTGSSNTSSILATSTTDENHGTSGANGGTDFQVTDKKGNMFSSLSDGHIVAIFFAVIIVAVILTTMAIQFYHAKKRKKSFDEFVQNLPNSRVGDSEEDLGVTTRTYRQDAPVYGSTGNVFDRNKNGATSPYSTDENSSDDTAKSEKPERRRPPPYESKPMSPDLGVDGPYSGTQFNNSSSAGMNFLNEKGWRHNAFSNMGYESDQSDDLWDISTLR